ncbi:transferase hexapeptide repeat-containing protein [Gorgonomyces haynaldii]|nr:transferase hexapeptide repeat-containing protein [Gorgonomyces haynaldii]
MSETTKPNSETPDKRSEREKMLSGDLYNAFDPELLQMRRQAAMNQAVINRYDPRLLEQDQASLLRKYLGTVGKDCFITVPVYFDYGTNIHLGDAVYMNFGCVLLDVAPIRIGSKTMLAPNVQLYTAGHPLDKETRISGLEFGKPITIGECCWVGGGAIILPGVTIGDNVVVAAGSVVTKDVPSNVIVKGNPARIHKSV